MSPSNQFVIIRKTIKLNDQFRNFLPFYKICSETEKGFRGSVDIIFYSAFADMVMQLIDPIIPGFELYKTQYSLFSSYFRMSDN